MLALRLISLATQSKKTVKYTLNAVLLGLSVLTVHLFLGVRPEEIPCHSDQLIANARYSIECLHVAPDELPVLEYRDFEYDEYSTILLTGSKKDMHLIKRIHKTAQSMQNRTKGYDIKIGGCSSLEMAKYFLVLKIEAGDETVLLVENRGWQANSDVFSTFISRLYTEDRTGVGGASLLTPAFNTISLRISEEGLEEVLGILHNLHNLYSHSLGVYFYWIVGEKGIFLSSNVLLVLCLAGFLGILELLTGGDFQIRLLHGRQALKLFLMGEFVFWEFCSFSFFEVFFVYCLLIPLNFPLAIILGTSRIILLFCELIGCSAKRDDFFCTVDLLYETISKNIRTVDLLPPSSSNGNAKGEEVLDSKQKY
ncbi:uncharacterized protein NEMAJ01_0180 [Nematocida major]|uniref:uncharacterized protein n=1 Tax=Nematocida major TaxID=1912982 RepID=UPI002007DBE2|nr:uncharacterized protein NEMAJ01_0180 [Nematocida major]KAH9385284.1 hypothetical protein NEMAJ01_0180 [Nematocida major]